MPVARLDFEFHALAFLRAHGISVALVPELKKKLEYVWAQGFREGQLKEIEGQLKEIEDQRERR